MGLGFSLALMAVSYPQMRPPPLLITVLGLGLLVAAGVVVGRGEPEESPVVEEEQDETGMTSEEREELMRIIGYVQQ